MSSVLSSHDEKAMRPAVFLDRDGVLNRDIGYAYRPDQIEWRDGAVDAIRYAPTHPDFPNNALAHLSHWRKLGTGMIDDLLSSYDVDLSKSSDIQAGKAKDIAAILFKGWSSIRIDMG